MKLRNDQARFLVQIEMDPHNGTVMRNLIDINAKYKDMAKKESLWFKQIAKKNWLTKGDDNMKFLYLSIKQIRSSNLIREIYRHDEIISDPILIGDSFCSYLSNFSTCLNLTFSLLMNCLRGFTLNSNQSQELSTPFTDQKNFQLKDINEDKTLGINDFTAKFFTYGWDLIGKKFLFAVNYFSKSFIILDIFKHTLITLIPKSKNATSLSYFRPISLCTTFYKSPC